MITGIEFSRLNSVGNIQTIAKDTQPDIIDDVVYYDIACTYFPVKNYYPLIKMGLTKKAVTDKMFTDEVFLDEDAAYDLVKQLGEDCDEDCLKKGT